MLPDLSASLKGPWVMLGEVWAGFQALQQLPTCWLEGRQSGGQMAVFRKRVLLTGVCFLTWALSSRDQRNPTMSHFFGKIPVCSYIYIYISFRGIDFPGAEAKSAAQIFEEKIWKLWRPTFLLMNRVCSCLYQVSSLIFCPFPPVFFLIPLCFWCSLECFKDVNYMVLSTSRMRYFCHVSLRSLNPLYHTWNFPFFTYI